MKTPFNRLSIRMKLVISFAALLCMFMTVAIFNYNQVIDIKKQLSEQEHKTDLQFKALELKETVQSIDVMKTGTMMTKNVSIKKEYESRAKAFEQLVNEIGQTAFTPEQRKWRAQLMAVAGEYTRSFDMAIKIIEDSSNNAETVDQQLQKLFAQSQTHKKYIFELIDKFNVSYSKEAKTAVSETGSMLDNTVKFAVMAAILVLVATASFTYPLILAIINPIDRLQKAVKKIAEGDLTHKINASTSDELGQLSRHFDQMTDKMQEILGSTRTIAATVTETASAFQQVAKVTADANADIVRAIEEISIGANQQADHSEKSAELIMELDEEIREINAFAVQMKQAGEEALHNTNTGEASVNSLQLSAEQSKQSMDVVYEALQTLTQQSKTIGQITNTITDLSTQTNVLALNAAIEAARAGVHGKGFSVIADEVRQLSEQSGDSSKKISQILDNLREQMQTVQNYMGEARNSMQLQNAKVNDTLDSFRTIDKSMSRISDFTEQIHSKVDAAKAKNETLIQSVQLIAAVAEQTAASVQEVNSTSVQQDEAIRRIAVQSGEMNGLSDRLFKEIGKFQVG